MVNNMVVKRVALCLIIVITILGIGVCRYSASAGDEADVPATDVSKLDVFFVIDNSGSMKKNDPKFITREVVMNFLNGLANNSRLGMIIFDQDARLVAPLTDKTDSEINALFIKSLDRVNYEGQFTNSPDGIERAIYELKMNGRNEAEKVIIFLTDGIVDTGNKQQDIEKEKWLGGVLAEESKKAEIRIFGIAFTENADFRLIQTLALKTDGEYFRAYTAADIPGIFIRINELINKPPVDTVALTTPPDETVSIVPPKPAPDTLVPEGDKAPTPEEYQAPTPEGDQSAPRKISFSFAIVIMAIVLFGAWILFKLLKARGKVPFKQDADNREPGGLPFPSVRSVPEAKLIDVKNAGSEASSPLIVNKEKVTIGRDSGNDIVIPQKTISGWHAAIEYYNGYFYLEDQRSTNGTLLNGRHVEPNRPVKLKSGDRISFAVHEFTFLVSDQVPVGQTVMLESSFLAMGEKQIAGSESKEEVDDFVVFKDCLKKHLQQVSALGSTYESFVNQHLNDEMVDTLADMAKEEMSLTQNDLDEHSAALAKPPIFYQLCTLHLEIEHARSWFAQKHGGYVKFLNHLLKSDDFTTPGCTILCLITYGRTKNAWVSITIVSGSDDSESIEIMSVEFLSEEEKEELSLDFGDLGRVI